MYFVALDSVSRYALNEAVKAIIRGALGHTFFPSPVEFRLQCDKAMEPHIRQAERSRLREEQATESARYQLVLAERTPESMERTRELYRQFCEWHEASKPKMEENAVVLDPDLLAKVPDAPSTFKQWRPA